MTSSIYSCDIIPPDMTIRSVFMELPGIVAFISSVKCPLDASKTSIPFFLRNTPRLLFHTTLHGAEAFLRS
jgi:hypothetical protein